MIKKIGLGVLGFLVGTVLTGFGANVLMSRVVPSLLGIYDGAYLDFTLLLDGKTYLYGALLMAMAVLLFLLFARPSAAKSRKLMKSKAENFESNLENSRFMTEKERDNNFDPYKFTKLSESSKDGIPVYA